MTNPGIYVCGTPRGGTSCVAGILHHLGVDMGEFDPVGPDGYCTFEDKRASNYKRPLGRHAGDSVLTFMAGANSGRDFRAYLAMREEEADGKPWGCKLGTIYPLSDPEPETLPLRWVFVDRPLETCIRSDRAKTKPENPIERSMQMAGYWAAKEQFKDRVPAAYVTEFGMDGSVVSNLGEVCGVEWTRDLWCKAYRSIKWDLIREWAPAN